MDSTRVPLVNAKHDVAFGQTAMDPLVVNVSATLVPRL